MVATKHCCWGTCKNDSRYPDRLPSSLKLMLDSGEKIFIPFPKPSQGLERCRRWMNACSRQNFTVESITKDTYICKEHWPGGKGPTKDFPDPLKANCSSNEATKASRKRKPPKQRERQAEHPPKKSKQHDVSQENYDLFEESFSQPEEIQPVQVTSKSTHVQTDVQKHELSTKIENMMLRNELRTISSTRDASAPKVISNIAYEVVVKNPDKMKHFAGLTTSQFEILYQFLNDICPLETLSYWGCKRRKISKNAKFRQRLSKWSLREKLYICLLRLKTGFTIKTLSYLLSSTDREIKESYIRAIFTTFIQLMYKVFRDMETVMFPSRKLLSRFLPRVFKTLKKVRCSIDCTEFRVETSRNFAQQGNTYSSYKHTNTFKCAIACTPNGGACFVSDLFEGDISDVEIFQQSGILKHIQPGDVILADRGFTVQDALYPLQAKVKLPPFLKGRKSLTAKEELDTRVIAKARIHIERFNQRLKQFKLVGRTIPLSIAPLATQMVVVACGIVNFQEVLCK